MHVQGHSRSAGTPVLLHRILEHQHPSLVRVPVPAVRVDFLVQPHHVEAECGHGLDVERQSLVCWCCVLPIWPETLVQPPSKVHRHTVESGPLDQPPCPALLPADTALVGARLCDCVLQPAQRLCASAATVGHTERPGHTPCGGVALSPARTGAITLHHHRHAWHISPRSVHADLWPRGRGGGRHMVCECESPEAEVGQHTVFTALHLHVVQKSGAWSPQLGRRDWDLHRLFKRPFCRGDHCAGVGV
mmetsp:Transcript_38786/g.76341  ORF Transcript_38786/g.76341 Transcript_38786/m.76341 type:complete len:247 (-) Transcript_38786:284-1024(-)